MSAFQIAGSILVGSSGIFLLLTHLADAGKRRLSKRARRIGRIDPITPQGARLRLRIRPEGGLDSFILRILPRPEALRARLAASGMSLSIGRYGLISAIVAIAVTILAILWSVKASLAILIGLMAGIFLPYMVVSRSIKRRRKRFSKHFREAIGLIIRGLRAGFPFADTMQVVAREVADPVGEEFRRISDQVRLGQTIEEAMWATARRLALTEFNFLVITLSIQRETGGNLAETLEIVDDMLRKREQMRMKVKAMSSEAIASAGIIGSLPFVMSGILYLVSRDYLMTMFTSHLGHMLLAGGGVSMAAGVLVMSQMVKFDI